jgi:hypothetical protein
MKFMLDIYIWMNNYCQSKVYITPTYITLAGFGAPELTPGFFLEFVLLDL